jgi:hypothetical protein
MRAAIPATLLIHFLSSLTPVLIGAGWLGVLILMGNDGVTATWAEKAVFILCLLLLFLVPVGLCFVLLGFVRNRKAEARGLLSGGKRWWISISTLWPLITMTAGWVCCTMVLKDEGFAMLSMMGYLPYSLFGTWMVYLIFLRPARVPV